MQKNSGFTLIELLVTVSIVLLLVGGGIAGFINFNDRQQVQTTVKNVQTLMRSAQVKARAGEGASDCVAPRKLRGYRITSTATAVIMWRYCVNPNNASDVSSTERSRVTLDNVTFTKTPNVNITFLALRGGVDMGSNTSVTYTTSGSYSTHSYAFQVLNTGEITEGAFQ